MNIRIVELQALQNASKRTRERIKQHGPVFRSPKEDDGEILVRTENWIGWLPKNQMRIIEVKDGISQET